MVAENKFPGLAKLAAVLCWLPLLGVLGIILGMQKAFAVLEIGNLGDPSQLSTAIDVVIWSAFAGAAVGIVGFSMALWYIFKKRVRPAWLVVSTCFAGLVVIWILVRLIWNLLQHSAA